MANTATALTDVRAQLRNIVRGELKAYKCVFDTTGSPLDVHTPAADKCVVINGIVYREADAHSLSFISGSTTLVTLQQPAFGGLDISIAKEPYLVTNLGEKLALQVDTAVIATLLIYVTEISILDLLR